MNTLTTTDPLDALAVIERQRSIEGYLLDESAAIWCFLLQEQQKTWSWDGLSAGDYLEIGAFKGKSASILPTTTTASIIAAWRSRTSTACTDLPQSRMTCGSVRTCCR